jgi:predicted RNA methylase
MKIKEKFMKFFLHLFDNDSSIKTITIVSGLLGIFTVIVQVVKRLKEVVSVKVYNHKRNLTGVYVSYATNMRLDNERFIHDVIEIKKTFWGSYRGNVVFHTNPARNHVIKFKIHRTKKDYFIGTWENLKDKKKCGNIELIIDDYNEGLLSGVWTGVTKENEVNGGGWFFRKVADIDELKKIDNLCSKASCPEVDLTNIIKKHKSFKKNLYRYDKYDFQIDKGQFNPLFGKISLPLISEVVTNPKRIPNKALDIGCGTGLYSIVLAKNGCKKCIGLDSDKGCIQTSRKNARKNDETQTTDFRINKDDDIYSSLKYSEKFDLIVSNLPFSANVKVNEKIDEVYLKNFEGNPQVLINFIIGSQLHLNPNGEVLFSFADSGYKELLHEIIRYTNYNGVEEIYSDDSGDDRYYIFKLQFDDEYIRAFS